MIKNKKLIGYSYLLMCSLLIMPLLAGAQSTSPNYKVEESFFGTGGEVDASSPSYRARQSTGSLGVGNSSSANYDAVSGFTTPSEPFLEAAVTGANIDFGSLSPSTTSYAAAQGGACNCSFYVRSYLSSDYSVVSASAPPTSENGDEIDAKSTQGAPSSSDSVEEFGINLVANTVPSAFGADPQNEPDNSFADGEAATGYGTTNQFKYTANDIVARSAATAGNQAVGKTNYTISYIIKPSNVTPAGQYTMRQILIVTPTF